MYERYNELLELCFKAKEKGIDCFFEYQPHVQHIRVYVFRNGYNKNFDYDIIFDFYLDWEDNEEYGPAKCLEAIAYINELLEEVI